MPRNPSTESEVSIGSIMMLSPRPHAKGRCQAQLIETASGELKSSIGYRGTVSSSKVCPIVSQLSPWQRQRLAIDFIAVPANP